MNRRNSKLVDFIKKYRMWWAVVTVAWNVLAILTVIFVFPNVSNLWVSIFVLAGGLSASIVALSDLLVTSEDT